MVVPPLPIRRLDVHESQPDPPAVIEASDTSGGKTSRSIPVDMRPVLTRIEELVPQLGGQTRLSLIAIYCLWHAILAEEYHQPSAASYLEGYRPELEVPSIQAFLVATVLGRNPPWTTAAFQKLAQDRLEDRTKGKAEPLPAVFDAALAAAVAMRLSTEVQRDEAAETLSRAVEELPGNARLMAAESMYRDSGRLTIDLHALVLGVALPDPNAPADEGDDHADTAPDPKSHREQTPVPRWTSG